ncbi:MAG: tetratricopeptide repeat protein [Alphaproteobacteria bacterium]|nr:tetratricopeptide repeat protein [Alphaproteobacteria bacterium]
MTGATGTVEQQVAKLLQEALGHLNRNNPSAAEAALQRVLLIDTEEAGALQLLGLVRRAEGRLAEAEQLYRRSLARDPAQPNVHCNLGNLLYHLGRFDDAIAACQEAIRQKPNYVDAYLRLGHALQSKGDYTAAEQAYRQCLRYQPNFLMAKQSLGGVLTDQGRAQEAERVLSQALAQGSPDPRQVAALQHNLGLALKQQRRFDEALALFDAAQAAAPDMPLVDCNRGNLFQDLGRLEEAVACYRRAIARNPLDLDAHVNLNKLLYRLKRHGEFLVSLDEAAERFPETGELPLSKGSLLFLVDRLDEAAEAYRRAAEKLAAHVTPHDGLGLIHARQGRFDEAIAAHETALRLEPENAHVWTNLADTLIRAGDPQRARDCAERAMAIEPTHQNALGIWGIALRQLDDPREQEINDYENMVRVYELPPPDGYRDMASFNRDLNAYLDRLHADRYEPLEQTVRGGTQTLDNLFGRGHAPVEKLRARIDEAVKSYIAAMKDDARHPLFRRKTGGMEYSASWSVRLGDRGFHTNHVHNLGWISSCYYVALPDAVDDIEGKQGWIKFGEPFFDAGFSEPIRRLVQPRVGTLVLFPSYMWHGTVPFRSDQTRTTIAFDVIPR